MFIICRSVLYSLLAILQFGFSQVDTAAVLSLFPLHVGDTWQYRTFEWLGPTEYLTYSIESDSTMPNGHHYFYHTRFRFVRVDSSDLKVYQYRPITGECGEAEALLFDLSPDTIAYESCLYEYPDSIAFTSFECLSWLTGSAVDCQTHSALQFIGQPGYDLAPDLGISAWVEGDFTSFHGELVAAIIDGMQFGKFVVGIDNVNDAPASFRLFQNFPNPFNPQTTISFELQVGQAVTLTVFDMQGREVRQLVSDVLPAGQHAVIWDALNQKGNPAASGAYYYRLSMQDVQKTRKMILAR